MSNSLGAGQLDTKADGTTELKLDNMAVIARAMFEYVDMFNLERDGVTRRLLNEPGATVLDVPGSTSAFGFQLRQMAKRGRSDLSVISADIVYDAPAQELYETAVRTARKALDPLLEKNTWEGQSWVSPKTPFHAPSDLLHYREVTYKAWLKDFKENREAYVTDSFPSLINLQGRKFNLIVSGNCLFAYADKLFGSDPDQIYQFHEQSLLTMAGLLKPGGELRVYPIGTASAPVYSRLGDLEARLFSEGYEVSIDPVDYPPNVKSWDRLLKVVKAR